MRIVCPQETDHVFDKLAVWGPHEPVWAHLGPHGPMCTHMDPLWAHMGPSGLIWAQYGPTWARGAPGGPIRAHMGPARPHAKTPFTFQSFRTRAYMSNTSRTPVRQINRLLTTQF